MFDSSQQSCPLLKLLGNMVAGEEGEREGRGRGREEKGRGRLGQQSMALSEDGKRLAIIGPLTCNITVLDALSLSEVRETNKNTHYLKILMPYFLFLNFIKTTIINYPKKQKGCRC